MVYEVVMPAMIALCCTWMNGKESKLLIALKGIADVMPTAISVFNYALIN